MRLEELAYATATAALDDAGVRRRQLDSVTLGASDEVDGRPISSMLLAAPSGAFMTDEVRVADSGATALCLAVARILSGDFHLGLVSSWCKSSKVDVDQVMNAAADPFYTRPLGMSSAVADGLFAQVVSSELGITEGQVAKRVADAFARAAGNPRGMGHAVPTAEDVNRTEYVATPLRDGYRAPFTDGAACMVLASGDWLRLHPEHKPLARISGVGWATDSYGLSRNRLGALSSARAAWSHALRRANLADAQTLDVVELDTPTGFHEAAYVSAFGLEQGQVTPSGGTFAQNPFVCAGLVNAVEATLQVSGRAGPVQRAGVRFAASHGCHGYAQQANTVVVYEGA